MVGNECSVAAGPDANVRMIIGFKAQTGVGTGLSWQSRYGFQRQSAGVLFLYGSAITEYGRVPAQGNLPGQQVGTLGVPWAEVQPLSNSLEIGVEDKGEA